MNPSTKDLFANVASSKKVIAPPSGTGDVAAVLSQYGNSVASAGGKAAENEERLRQLLLQKRKSEQMRAMGIATSIRASASPKALQAKAKAAASFNKSTQGQSQSLAAPVPAGQRPVAPPVRTIPKRAPVPRASMGENSALGTGAISGTGTGDPFAEALWGGTDSTGNGGTTSGGFGSKTNSGFGSNANSGFGGNSNSGFGGNSNSGFGGNPNSGFGSKPAFGSGSSVTASGSASGGGAAGWVNKSAGARPPTGGLNASAATFVPGGAPSAGAGGFGTSSGGASEGGGFMKKQMSFDGTTPSFGSKSASSSSPFVSGKGGAAVDAFAKALGGGVASNDGGLFPSSKSSDSSGAWGKPTGGIGSQGVPTFGSQTTGGGGFMSGSGLGVPSSSGKSIFGSPAPPGSGFGVSATAAAEGLGSVASSPIVPFSLASKTPGTGTGSGTSAWGAKTGATEAPASVGASVAFNIPAAPSASSASLHSLNPVGSGSSSSLASTTTSRSGGVDRTMMDDSLYITDDDDDEEEDEEEEEEEDAGMEGEEGEDNDGSGDGGSDRSEMDDYLSDEAGDGDGAYARDSGASSGAVSIPTGARQKLLVSSVSGTDLYAGGDGIEGVKYGGTCLEMDPEELAQRRAFENDVHKVEQKLGVMIKKLQRSSADHELQITRYIRPPFVLLSTVEFIEDNVMELGEIVEEEPGAAAAGGLANFLGGGGASSNIITPIEAYLYIWDRYRMVAKDFILQMASDELPSSSAAAAAVVTADAYANMFLMMPPHPSVAIGGGECLLQRMLNDVCCVHVHERMTRWFIMMDHYMCTFEEFVSQHKQQNGEQLFRLIKSLNEFYLKSRSIANKYQFDPMFTDGGNGKGSPAVQNYDMLLNESEFASYFILYQLDNGKEVPVFIRGLEADVLNSRDVQFAIKVWTARKTQDYARFFQLLRGQATYLQACIMYKYVTSTRLQAMRKITRSYRVAKAETYISLVRLTRMLAFEDEADTREFFTYCGYDIEDGFDGEDVTTGAAAASLCVVLTAGQVIDKMLPVDKNGHAIPPVAKMMENTIEAKVLASKFTGAKAVRNFESDQLYLSKADICRGEGCTGKRVVHTQLTRWIDELSKNKSLGASSGRATKVTPAPVALRAAPTKKVAATPAPTAGFNPPPAARAVLPKSTSSSKLALSGALGGSSKSVPDPPQRQKPAPPAAPVVAPRGAASSGFGVVDLQPPPSKSKTSVLQGSLLSSDRDSSSQPPAAMFNFGGSGAKPETAADSKPDNEDSGGKKTLPPLTVEQDSPPAASPPTSVVGTTRPPLEQKLKKTAALTNLATFDPSPAFGGATKPVAPAVVSSNRGIGFDSVGIADDEMKPAIPTLSIELPGVKLPPLGGTGSSGSDVASRPWSFTEPAAPPTASDKPPSATGAAALGPPSLTADRRAVTYTPMSLHGTPMGGSRMGTPGMPMSIDATPASTPPNGVAAGALGLPGRTGGPTQQSRDMALSSPQQAQMFDAPGQTGFTPVDGAATGSAGGSDLIRVQPQRNPVATHDPLARLTKLFDASAHGPRAASALHRRGEEIQRRTNIGLLRRKLRAWRALFAGETLHCQSLLRRFCFRKWLRVLRMRHETRSRFLASFNDSGGSNADPAATANAVDVLLTRRVRRRENRRSQGRIALSSQWALDRDKQYFHLHGPNSRYKPAGPATVNNSADRDSSLYAMLQHHLGSDYSPEAFADLFPSPCDICAPPLYYLQSLYVYCMTNGSGAGTGAGAGQADLLASEDPHQLFACSQRGRDGSVAASFTQWRGNLLYKLALCSSAGRSGQWEFKHHKPIYGYGQHSVKVPNNFTGHYMSPNIIRSLLSTEVSTTANPLMIGLHEKSAVCHSQHGGTFGGAQLRRQTRVSVIDLCAQYSEGGDTGAEDQRLQSPAPASPFVQGCSGAVLLISEYDILCTSDEEFAASMSAQLVCLMKNRHAVRSGTAASAASIPPVVLIFTRDRLLKGSAEKSSVDWHVLSVEHYRQQAEVSAVGAAAAARGTCDDDVLMVQAALQRIQALVGMHIDTNFQLKGVYVINARLSDQQGFPYFDLAQLAQYQLCLSGALNLLVTPQSLGGARGCCSKEELMALEESGSCEAGARETVGTLLEQNCSSLVPLVVKVDIVECVTERLNEAIWAATESASSSASTGDAMEVDASGSRFGADACTVLDAVEQAVEGLVRWLQFSSGALPVEDHSAAFTIPAQMVLAFPAVDFCAAPAGGDVAVACDAVLFENRVVDSQWGDAKLPLGWNDPTDATNSNVDSINTSVGLIQALAIAPFLRPSGLVERMQAFSANLDQQAASCSNATNINLWRDKLSKSTRGLVGLICAADSLPDSSTHQLRELRRLWGQRLVPWQRAVSMLLQFVVKAKFRGVQHLLYAVAEATVPPVEKTVAKPSAIAFLLQTLTGAEVGAVSKRRKREDDAVAVSGGGAAAGAGGGLLPSSQTKRRITADDVALTMQEVSDWGAKTGGGTSTSAGATSSAALEIVTQEENVNMAGSPGASVRAVTAAALLAQQDARANQANKLISDLHSEMGDEFQRAAAFNAFMARQLQL